ncbi:MAG: transcription termination factor Rho [Actinomycetota bacterium]
MSIEKETLQSKKVAELQVIAGELGVATKGLKKAQLMEAIIAKGTAGTNGSKPGKRDDQVRVVGVPEASKPSTAPSTPDSSAKPSTEASSDKPSATERSEPQGTSRHQVDGRPEGEVRRDNFRDRDRDRGRRRRGRDRGRDRGPDRGPRDDRGQRDDRPRDDRGPRDDRPREDRGPREPEVINEAELENATGILDILPEGFGFLRTSGYLPAQEDVYVSLSQVRRFHLRRGDAIVGMARRPKESEKYRALVRIETVNEKTAEEIQGRPWFERLTPLYPEQRIRLEMTDDPTQISQRIIDLVAPIGKGQRGMIVSPPKAGKTTVMKQIANSIRANAPECHLIVLLVDERPEEVTDMQRSVDGEIVYSTFDRPSDDHIQVTELTLDRAKRMVEMGNDVVILLDGITRLSRAYNLATPASGRILSGGVDSTALYPPKKFFGAARNIEQGGSLTIIATALVETGSRMDEVIFEEFKGTGNWELRLDRRASEKRIFPAIDIEASGTRKEELLLTKDELSLVWKLRRVLHALEGVAGLELLIDKMRQTKGNLQFLMEVGKQNTGD